MHTRKINFSKIKNGDSWVSLVTDDIIAAHPDTEIYTTAAGISPSGVVHFGNFRDVVTSHLIRRALEARGKNAQLIFSWDNFDRYRKVPKGVPESFSEHIGKPLSKIPDPVGSCHASYAEHFQKPFVEAMDKLGIEIKYRDQTALYESGIYDEAIFHALKERIKIADILLSFMTEKAKNEKGIDPNEYRKNYYPIAIYSRFNGTDITKILAYDGNTNVTYRCLKTGKEEVVDLSKVHIAKLAWKPDWAMRWRYEQVHFEPGGHDHASPGGSYDAASVIAQEIFGYTAPFFAEYKFVGIQGLGSKMSGSKGNAVSPLELLDIYEPDVLKWLYFRKSPDQSFELAFNTEIYRQYDEYDSEYPEQNAMPFRQVVGFGQIIQWQEDKLQIMLDELKLSYSPGSIALRLPLARNWLTKYNPDEMITLNDEVNVGFAATLSNIQKLQIQRLHDELQKLGNPSISKLEILVYSIPKSPELSESKLKEVQREFFKIVYNLLINKDTGPRLGTFLWAVNKEKILNLLKI